MSPRTISGGRNMHIPVPIATPPHANRNCLDTSTPKRNESRHNAELVHCTSQQPHRRCLSLNTTQPAKLPQHRSAARPKTRIRLEQATASSTATLPAATAACCSCLCAQHCATAVRTSSDSTHQSKLTTAIPPLPPPPPAPLTLTLTPSAPPPPPTAAPTQA